MGTLMKGGVQGLLMDDGTARCVEQEVEGSMVVCWCCSMFLCSQIGRLGIVATRFLGYVLLEHDIMFGKSED
jgi:hypothetical protein